MYFLKRIWLAAICIVAFSCSLLENLELDPQTHTTAYRICSQRYYFSDKTFCEIKFVYDSTHQLVQKKWYNPRNEMDFHENFEYDKGQLIRINRSTQAEFAEARFTYNNGHVETSEYWMKDNNGSLQKFHTTNYTYLNGQLTKTTTTFYNGKPAAYALYTYENGNITSIKSYELATDALLEVSTFIYDSHPNPFYQMSHQYLGSPVTSSKNNVVGHTILSYKAKPENSAISYEYTFNKKGYPVEKYLLTKNNKRYLDESYSYSE